MLVSIIVPCYNMQQYLHETLESVLSQKFPTWECIIVNDGSVDKSEDIALEWQKKDSRFKYFWKENGGLSSARNFGIERSSGELIVPLDADDILHTLFIEKCVSFLCQNLEYRIVYAETQLFGDREDCWRDNFDYNEFAKRNLIPCTACFYKKDWKMAGGYDEDFKNGFEDWDFWISLVEKGIKVHKINEPLFYYRQRANSMAQNISEDIANEIRRKIGLKHLKFFANHFGNPLSMFYEKQQIQREIYLLQKSRTFKVSKALSRIFRMFYT